MTNTTQMIRSENASAAGAAIRLTAVSRRFAGKNGAGLQILDGIDLDIAEGEFVALIGASGCGKSTLLNIISGLLPASSGHVEIFGSPSQGLDPRIGYMFQTDALLPWRNLIDNVAMGLELDGMSRKDRYARAKDILAVLGLAGFEDHYPSELSGGMRQRASLARTWLKNPQIILMDEPFGALDSQTRLIVQASFLEFWESHRKTAVLVTHDLGEAIAMADRVIVLSSRPGRIKAEYRIDIPRPRRLDAMRSDPRFTALWQNLWDDLRPEVVQGGV